MTAQEDRPTTSSKIEPLGEGKVSPHPQNTRVQPPLRAWQVTTFALAMAASIWVVACFIYAPRVGASDVREVLGYVARFTHFDSLPAHGIASFDPHSPLPSAGVERGDLILDPPRGTLLPGESVRLRIRHNGTINNVDIRSDRTKRLSSLINNILSLCLDAFTLTFGVTIAFRRRNDVAALAIACSLLLATLGIPPEVFPVGDLGRLWFVIEDSIGVFAIAALAYAVLMYEGGYRSRARSHLLRILVGICLAWSMWTMLVLAPYFLGRVWISPENLLFPVEAAGSIVALAVCVLAFSDAWRHTEGEAHQRLRWLLLAYAIALIGTSITPAYFLGVFGFTSSAETLANLGVALMVALSVVTLTYAVLRHQVIDVGFVINRTLVFAIFTSMLLVLFGVVEWLVDHLVQFEQRESSAVIDGGLAVAIYLIFHRLRDWVERLVEHVFFRKLQSRQMALEHFLETARNFSEPESLRQALLKAVDAYAGSQGSALYRRDNSGHFLLETTTLGDLPRELKADAEVIIELKSSHTPYYIGPLGFASPALTVAIVRRSELVGFLVVAQKTDRTMYRADEIEKLVRAVQQVSSDLYALQVERLQQRSDELEQQNEVLRQELRACAAKTRPPYEGFERAN